MANRIHFVFLNIGHFFDHLFMLIFATVAALALAREWGMSYGGLIPYATPGLRGLWRVRSARRLACRQVEPQGHDVCILCRYWLELNLNRAR